MNPTDTSQPDYYHRIVDCQWACPAHTDVPEYIRLIAQGRFTDAYMLNRESNVFPGILGRICDRPCEPACRRGRVDDKPVAICRLKRVAADLKGDITDRLPQGTARAERQARRLHRRRPGLAHGRQRSHAARLRGHDVRAARQAGRPDAHQHPLVPPAAERCSTRRSACILDMGVDIRYNSPVTSLKALLERRASTRSSSAAARRAARISSCPGRHDDATDIHIGIDWLESVAFGHVDDDRRAGADHRRGQHRDGLLPLVAAPRRQGHQGDGAPPREFFKASPWELEDAEEEGVEIVVNHAPKRFVHRGRQARRAWSSTCSNGTRRRQHHRERVVDDGHRPVRRRDPRHRPGERLPLDRARPRHRVRQMGHAGRRRDRPSSRRGPASSSAATRRSGPKNIIWAVEHGHQAAISIHNHCQGESGARPPAARHEPGQPEDGHAASGATTTTTTRRRARR